MKKLLFLLLFLPVVALSQQKNDRSFYVYQDTAEVLNRAYVNSQVDTCKIYGVLGYNETHLGIQTKDSAEVYVKYQLSVDGGTTWGALTTKDSLIATAAAAKVFDLSSTVSGATHIKLHFAFEAAGNGVTSATYTARLVQRH